MMPGLKERLRPSPRPAMRAFDLAWRGVIVAISEPALFARATGGPLVVGSFAASFGASALAQGHVPRVRTRRGSARPSARLLRPAPCLGQAGLRKTIASQRGLVCDRAVG